MPRVSILLTCYNHLSYLPAALESIRAQTFADYEIIAIDDGSTDGSRDFLSAQSDVKCIFNPTNLGTYDSLNVGLGEAKGEFLAILNDDDFWGVNKLADQVAFMDAHPEVGIVHSGGGFVDSFGAERLDNPLGFDYPVFETGEVLPRLIRANQFIVSAVMLRTSVVRQVGEFNPHYFGHGDWEYWWRMCEVSQAGFVPGPHTFYRLHDSQASQNSTKIWNDDERLRHFMLGRLDEVESRFSPDDLKLAKAFLWAAAGHAAHLLGDQKRARASFVSSLHYHPTRLKTYARYLATFLKGQVR